MLSQLRVRDFALVDSVDVEFHVGFNVLSGETGAGKTVLIGAIGLLLGDRGDSMMVRSGAEEAVLEASFDLSSAPAVRQALGEHGYADASEDELTLGRRLPREGKSRCTVNGRMCPVSALSDIGDLLVEVHGQNTHQALLKQSSHIGYLDRYAGQGHLKDLDGYGEAYSRLRSLTAERSRARGGTGLQDSAREIELLEHEIHEIESAAVEPGELEVTEERASRFRHARELWELASRVENALSAGEQSALTVRDLLTQASGDITRMASRDASIEPLAARLDSLSLEAEDIAGEVEIYRESLDTDPALLEQVETRLSLLRELSRKYGGSLDAVEAYLARAKERLSELAGLALRATVIDSEIKSALADVTELAARLTGNRRAAIVSLEEAVASQMAGLGLSGAGFKVQLLEKACSHGKADVAESFGPKGSDEVEFLFSPEPGEPERPLRRIASGGEMSRVMLALKIVLAEADRLPVLVFDEVDAGIGGETASTVGEKLYELTRYHQVFCVTHLPQIASFADWQYGVFKTKDDSEGARTAVALLEDDARVAEVCRMLGDASGRRVTAEHARDIIKRAGTRKKTLGRTK